MNLVVSIILFLVVSALIFFVFFLRIKSLQESKRITQYFENLRDKFRLQMSFRPKEANNVLPMLKGLVQNRDTLIERTIQEKYKYFVISISLDNKPKISLQITPKNHLRGKEKPDESQIISTGIARIDSNYFVSASQKEFLKIFLNNFFLQWEQKYASVWHLFSTLVIFGSRITLVLLSTPQRIKYDLLIEQFLQDLQEVASEIENLEN